MAARLSAGDLAGTNPAGPSKQVPPASTSLDGKSPSSPLADSCGRKDCPRLPRGMLTTPDSPLKELAWTVGDWVDDEREAYV